MKLSEPSFVSYIKVEGNFFALQETTYFLLQMKVTPRTRMKMEIGKPQFLTNFGSYAGTSLIEALILYVAMGNLLNSSRCALSTRAKRDKYFNQLLIINDRTEAERERCNFILDCYFA